MVAFPQQASFGAMQDEFKLNTAARRSSLATTPGTAARCQAHVQTATELGAPLCQPACYGHSRGSMVHGAVTNHAVGARAKLAMDVNVYWLVADGV